MKAAFKVDLSRIIAYVVPIIKCVCSRMYLNSTVHQYLWCIAAALIH